MEYYGNFLCKSEIIRVCFWVFQIFDAGLLNSHFWPIQKYELKCNCKCSLRVGIISLRKKLIRKSSSCKFTVVPSPIQFYTQKIPGNFYKRIRIHTKLLILKYFIFWISGESSSLSLYFYFCFIIIKCIWKWRVWAMFMQYLSKGNWCRNTTLEGNDMLSHCGSTNLD